MTLIIPKVVECHDNGLFINVRLEVWIFFLPNYPFPGKPYLESSFLEPVGPVLELSSLFHYPKISFMKHYYFIKELLRWVMTASILYLSATTLSSQIVRPYTTVYSDNLKGGHTIFGNTILARDVTAMNSFISSPFGDYGITSTYGNDNANMQFVDIDGNASTYNSSSADLVLPAGTNTIKFARLYWGGRIDTTITIAANRNKVKIKKAGGVYNTIDAPLCQMDQYNVTGKQNVYQVYYDVTTFINMNGAGTYTVADVALSTGSIGGGGYFGGWAMVVVFENPDKSYSSVRIYDGFLQVYDEGSPVTQSITLTGLNVPSVPTNASDAYLSVMSWEGDANLAASWLNPDGDYMKVNGVKVSNTVNPVKNFWNGTISKNGAFITTKNPDYKNQMGIDIDEQDVGIGYGLQDGTNDIPVEFGTEADQYFPSLFAFTIIAKPAVITLELAATTSILPYNLLNPNEDVTYTLSGTNTGPAHAHNCIVIDTVPHCLSYKPGSLKIISTHLDYTGIMTDASGDDQAEVITTPGGITIVQFRVGAGANGSAGGTLEVGETYQLEFKCVTPANATIQNSVVDFARITGIDDTNSPLVDDGMVVLGPGGIPLAVKMKSFAVIKQGSNALLHWVTESEINNDMYEIERSIDGINFVVVGSVKGAGTVTEVKRYSFTDPILQNSKTLFYRLRITDLDGKVTYSWIEKLYLDGSVVSGMMAYPNPFTANPKIQLYCERETEGMLSIMNSAGQQAYRKNIKLSRGVNIIVLTEMNNLNSGLYIVDIIADNIKLSQKLTKQ